MRRHLILIVLSTLLLLGTRTIFGNASEDIITSTPNGTVNWTKATLQATGIGVFPRQRPDLTENQLILESNAQKAAGDNLLQLLSELRIDSQTTVADVFRDNPYIKMEVVQMINNLEPIKTVRNLSKDTVQVTLQFELRGKFSRLILPADIKQIKPIKPIAPTSKEASDTNGSPTQIKQHSQSKAIIHTGLIVDAKGLKNVKPTLVPRIVDESGQEIYGPAFVSREFAVLTGISGYSRNLTVAQNSPRVRYHPLIVKGLKTNTIDSAMIVVSNSDASKLRAASENLSFLRKCRVIIVLD